MVMMMMMVHLTLHTRDHISTQCHHNSMHPSTMVYDWIYTFREIYLLQNYNVHRRLMATAFNWLSQVPVANQTVAMNGAIDDEGILYFVFFLINLSVFNGCTNWRITFELREIACDEKVFTRRTKYFELQTAIRLGIELCCLTSSSSGWPTLTALCSEWIDFISALSLKKINCIRIELVKISWPRLSDVCVDLCADLFRLNFIIISYFRMRKEQKQINNLRKFRVP